MDVFIRYGNTKMLSIRFGDILDGMILVASLCLCTDGTANGTADKVVVPHCTASYADGPKDQEDDAIPMCTLRNFPSLIEHCIEWARSALLHRSTTVDVCRTRVRGLISTHIAMQ